MLKRPNLIKGSVAFGKHPGHLQLNPATIRAWKNNTFNQQETRNANRYNECSAKYSTIDHKLVRVGNNFWKVASGKLETG
jgi:hypothetical protein